ncbi:MAG: transcription termination/antitermination protein NusG [Nitrospirota bacterium]
MWYAIYTKPAREDLVSSRLQTVGIEILNPKIRAKKYRKHRLVEVVEPLFPNYLFASFERERYAHLITYTSGVRFIVGKDNPVVVHDEIVSAIKERVGPDNILILRPEKFACGDRVRIKEGPFKDFHGIFTREVRGPERVTVLLDALHCSVELDGCLLAAA